MTQAAQNTTVVHNIASPKAGETPLSRRRLRAWLRLLQVTRSTENHLREFLRVEFNTTLPRFDVCAALYRVGKPMRMNDLSQMLLVSNGNATAVVDRLERDGLAERKPCERDRRAVLVSLTPKGRDWFEKVADAHEAQVDHLFASLKSEDLDLVRDLTRRINGAQNDPLA